MTPKDRAEIEAIEAALTDTRTYAPADLPQHYRRHVGYLLRRIRELEREDSDLCQESRRLLEQNDALQAKVAELESSFETQFNRYQDLIADLEADNKRLRDYLHLIAGEVTPESQADRYVEAALRGDEVPK